MDVSGEYRIARPREAVWDALMDPGILSRCIPGCQSLEQTASDRFRARIALAIGPVRAAFDSDLNLVDLHRPVSYRLTGSGRAGPVGFGQGEASVVLAETDAAETLLSYTAGFQVGGRLAQVGSRLVLGTTRKLVDTFFENLVRELTATADRVEPPPEDPRPRPIKPLIAMLVAGIVLVGVILWWLGASA